MKTRIMVTLVVFNYVCQFSYLSLIDVYIAKGDKLF